MHWVPRTDADDPETQHAALARCIGSGVTLKIPCLSAGLFTPLQALPSPSWVTLGAQGAQRTPGGPGWAERGLQREVSAEPQEVNRDGPAAGRPQRDAHSSPLPSLYARGGSVYGAAKTRMTLINLFTSVLCVTPCFASSKHPTGKSPPQSHLTVKRLGTEPVTCPWEGRGRGRSASQPARPDAHRVAGGLAGDRAPA